MPREGFTTITLTEEAERELRAFHKLLTVKGVGALPQGVRRPAGDGLTMSEAIVALTAIGRKTLTRRGAA